jgi:hypothetical protein
MQIESMPASVVSCKCLTVALGPLRVEELADVLTIDF